MKTKRRIATRSPRLWSALSAARAVTLPVRNHPLRSLAAYPRFIRQWRHYRSLGGRAAVVDLRPQLLDATATHLIDHHYLQQGAWAMRRVVADAPDRHVDVGGQTLFVVMLAALVPVEFVDIRPLGAAVPGVIDRPGSILQLPYESRTIRSLSCLHVAEHIGLGRYGDPLDPDGTARAASELTRVLHQEGLLYVGLPVGQPRTEFNAHRIHAVHEVTRLFPELVLEEFSIVDDAGVFHASTNLDGWDDQRYACGLFAFRRRG